MLNQKHAINKRLLLFLLVAIFIFFVIFCRLAYIQVVWGKELQARAMQQWTRSLPITGQRGRFLDANGVVLVDSYTCYSVYVRAKNVTEPERLARTLSDVLGVDYQIAFKKAINRGISESTIKKQVTAEQVEQIKAQNLDGIYFATESIRQYPYGDLLTQVLGFVSIDNKGQWGLESYYDEYLRGIDGKVLTQSDLIGVEIENEEMLYLPAVDGFDVVLTIDYVIQGVVEDVLDIIMKSHSPKSAQCIVMDVTNGQILAMSSKPSYDLNEIPRDDVSTLMSLSRNTMVTDIFEPGSTFKILTAAASLEEAKKGNVNAFDKDHIFTNNSDHRYVGGGKIKCWTKHINGKHCNQNLGKALNNSCNPIFTDIALSLGKDTFYEYLRAFGYGSKTGIDYAGEQSGMLVNQSRVTEGDLARIGFGQTIAVTPLQLCCATASAINGGTLYQPYLVKEIVDKNTGLVVKSFAPTVKGNPISQETSEIMALLLEDVVTNGSGKKAYIEGYRVGGKTGTAQKYVNGVIAQGKNISSFIGFFPADSPKYLALVMVDEPVGISYGSQVAAPYAKIIFQQIINYLELEPSKVA